MRVWPRAVGPADVHHLPSHSRAGQYLPALYHQLAPNAGKKRVAAFRSGQTGYDSIQNPWAVIFGSNPKPAAALGSEAKRD